MATFDESLDDAVLEYVDALFVEEPALLSELRQELEERGLPLIQVPARTGRVLELLARVADARRVLEIGTLGGYSALWLLRGMAPDGRLVTVEKVPEHAELARELFQRAGEAHRVEVRVGDAREVVSELGLDGTWDLVFIDADKEGYSGYLAQAARILRPGGVVLADNALWQGRVLDEEDREASTEGVRAFNRALARSDDFQATILPVGDGVAFGVRAPGRSASP
ncbi:MAG: O-methyltransferase [Longimicrobiales bacterium]|nr:O-methyltransferase [Longimicrobiales bacterium]